jgi:hypothetical protein
MIGLIGTGAVEGVRGRAELAGGERPAVEWGQGVVEGQSRGHRLVSLRSRRWEGTALRGLEGHLDSPMKMEFRRTFSL